MTTFPCVLMWQDKEKTSFLASLRIRALIPSWGSKPHDLIYWILFQEFHHQIPSYWRWECQHMNFRGRHNLVPSSEIRTKFIFLPCGYLAIPAPHWISSAYYWKIKAIYTGVYFWTLHSFQLTVSCTLMSLPQCLDYFSFLASFKIGSGNPSDMFFSRLF